jgi:iron complex outermembrane receptor protein
MHRYNRIAAGLLLGTLSSILHAQESVEPVLVTATRSEFRDTEAPYASEVHGRRDIERSAAVSLYDYLDRHSSLNVTPGFGNPFVQKIDMRGYGIGDGHQNIVVTLNGRRLNNIDMVPQLLSAIPLASIERIEITKGSGSVLYGDGATAGAIHIITRDIDGAAVMASSGSHGIAASSVAAGINGDYAGLTVTAENYRQDGFRDPDTAGTRDAADSDNLLAMLRVYPSDTVELRLGKALSWIDTVYGKGLTQAQFEADPAQNGGKTYTGQTFRADNSSIGLSADLGSALRLSLDHHREDKRSEYSSGWRSDYDYRSTDLALHYSAGDLFVGAGLQNFDGSRKGSYDTTGKENTGHYAQGHYRLGATTVAAGVRRETVRYSYRPTAGSVLADAHTLDAWDVGVNHRLDEQLTLFASYNSAFQAPDIDRFFSGGSFNAFIVPARSRTLNLGLNHVGAGNKLKLTAFHISLDNEIYYYSTGNWLTSYNTNIDKSHKYGLEVQDSYRFNERLNGSFNYAWTRAYIDSEDAGGGAYDGKELPGVSEHSVVLGLGYALSPQSLLTLSHSWRSETWAAEDFANSFSQKQAAYHSTGLGYSHRLERMELFVRIDNLFDHANGLWISDDNIYPVNFTRTWRVGIRAEL